MAITGSMWSPASWRGFPALQQPDWPSPERVEAARARLAAMPPLVFAGEARALRDALAKVGEGRAFLLQAGDCVESFQEFTAITIREKLKIMLQMAAVLTYGAMLPVVKVGRIAGQFVKPRSSPTERVGDEELPSFRGHMVNGETPTHEARRPDPERMLQGYHQSAATLNLVRAFTKGGFADLNQVHMWNQEFVSSSPQGRRYETLASEIERALRFMAACGIDLADEPQLHQVDFWTSHEGLLLEYEESLTRRDSLTGDWYDCSAHMLWIGERARRRPSRVHRRRRDGVPRRLDGGRRGAPRRALHEPLRSTSERAAVARPRLSRRRANALGLARGRSLAGGRRHRSHRRLCRPGGAGRRRRRRARVGRRRRRARNCGGAGRGRRLPLARGGSPRRGA